MRGKDGQQLNVFSYVSPEQRVPQDPPLHVLRAMTDEALQQLQPRFNKLYAKTGRPSIAPEKLLRALLLQARYSVRSERMLMEQLDYNLLFRWFVGLNRSRLPFAKRAVAECADCGKAICDGCRMECCGDSYCGQCYDYHETHTCVRKHVQSERAGLRSEVLRKKVRKSSQRFCAQQARSGTQAHNVDGLGSGEPGAFRYEWAFPLLLPRPCP